MKTKGTAAAIVLIVSLILCGCGEDPELTRFKTNFENFCINVSTLDNSINNIDATSDTATGDLLKYIGLLDEQFKALANLDFPEEFEYLEELSDQASEYMSEASSAYQKAYADDTYDASMSEYAYKNYKRAYKRIQIILIYLHGDEPQDEDLISE
ncbi:MAG: hypothetical protein IJZ34_06745 [Lachnospiraceae bacterium]|nr:hypothetical protein [Lachnospiraceae bacterium]